MKKVIATLIGALIVTFGLFIVYAFAQSDEATEAEADQTKFDIEAATCWEVVTLPEGDEAFALLADPDRLAEMGSRARARAEACTWSNHAEQVLKLYARVRR